MKRWPRVMLMLVVWLVIGAGITVVVAWGAVREKDRSTAAAVNAALGGNFQLLYKLETAQPPHAWPVAVPKEWPSPTGGTRQEGLGWTEVAFDSKSGWWTRPNRYRAELTYFGWPSRALCVVSLVENRRNGTRWSHEIGALRSAWMSSGFGVDPAPYLPLWPGFAVDTILYAALAWGLWQVPLFLRRRHRRARNRCIRCGYSLAGLAAEAPCPECGRA